MALSAGKRSASQTTAYFGFQVSGKSRLRLFHSAPATQHLCCLNHHLSPTLAWSPATPHGLQFLPTTVDSLFRVYSHSPSLLLISPLCCFWNPLQVRACPFCPSRDSLLSAGWKSSFVAWHPTLWLICFPCLALGLHATVRTRCYAFFGFGQRASVACIHP